MIGQNIPDFSNKIDFSKMPKFQLFLKCELENLSFIAPIPGAVYYIKFQCSNCREITENNKWNSITSRETSPVSGSRGEANLVMKCKGCKRENCVDIVPLSEKSILLEKSGIFCPIIEIECRGLEPIQFDPRDGFFGEGTSGTKFDIDLGSGDWTEYDENTQQGVSILNIESRIERSK